jgi:hypothetical protein
MSALYKVAEGMSREINLDRFDVKRYNWSFSTIVQGILWHN